jgi:hypothetical protein
MKIHQDHQLRSLLGLAHELGIDSGWLLTKAERGYLPAAELPDLNHELQWFFHRDAAANVIAEMILTNSLERKDYPPIECNESELEAASE